MKEITILSGKGGTGKTSISAALGALTRDAILCDSDVDAADLHLLMQPKFKEKHVFLGAWVASINTNKCSACKRCAGYCRFNAIHTNSRGDFYINPFQCEGCRLCERICPENAITSLQSQENHWFISKTRFGTMVHAAMGPGEENSGKLVTHVRKKAREQANIEKAGFIINDGPPGIGCATIASLSGTNAVLLVIEPTKSGLHDIKRLVELIKQFSIPPYAIINKYDINDEMTGAIESYLNLESIPLLGKIPFSEHMVEAMLQKKTIVEFDKGTAITDVLKNVWNHLQKKIMDNDKFRTIQKKTG